MHTVCKIDYTRCRAVGRETIIAITNVNPVRLHRKEPFLGKFLVHCDCEKRLKTIITESMQSAADFDFPPFAEEGARKLVKTKHIFTSPGKTEI